MTAPDWSRLVANCLGSTEFMALATSDGAKLWNHAVYFAWDRDVNLYFMSQPRARHMTNITANSLAAAAVFSTSQVPTKDVVGLQLSGSAKILSDAEIPLAHNVYFKRAPQIEGIPHRLEDFLGPNATWKLVQLTPLEIGYFDTSLFGDIRQTVPPGVRL